MSTSDVFPPPIAPGEATTLVPFPVSYFSSTAAPGATGATTATAATPHFDLLDSVRKLHARQHILLVATISMMVVLYLLPKFLMRNRLFGYCLGKRMRMVFLLLSLVNLFFFGYVMSQLENVSVNGLFFLFVHTVENVLSNVERLLQSCGAIIGVLLLLSYRSNVIKLLGLENHPVINADCRDMLTCFSMHRFRPIELSIAQVTGLPKTQTVFQAKTRPLFCHVQAGKYNEPRATRVKEVGYGEDYNVKEKMQLNYDREDLHKFKLTLTVQRQEIVGQDAAQALMPAAGAVAGGVFGGALYPVTGAVAGAGFGMSAASAFGDEIARVELSTMMINDMLLENEEDVPLAGDALHSTRFDLEAGSWRTLNLVPMGEVRLRFRYLDNTDDEHDVEHASVFADLAEAFSFS
ncbi:unnamed protein product [Amoebophrya sp. A120]|nr:unnamed protein product [Amoebophrya sp. A120]|eukprot:GSA120T00003077001.1